MPIRRVQITELEDRAAKLEKALKLATRTAQADIDTAVFPTGRLSISGSNAVNANIEEANSTVHYLPYIGNTVPIFSGSMWRTLDFGDSISLVLDSDSGHTNYHQENKNFDLFCALEEGTGSILLGSGPQWSSDTVRGSGAGTSELTRLDGIRVNRYDMVLRYGSGANDLLTVGSNEATFLGVMRPTKPIATTYVFDSVLKRHLWNCYNRGSVDLRAVDTTDNWSYSTNSWRQANASAANLVSLVTGLRLDLIEIDAYGMVLNSTTTARRVGVGIGVGSTTVNSAQILANGAVVDLRLGVSAKYSGFLFGYQELVWLERGAGSDTQTWYGDNGSDMIQSGLIGRMWV